MMRRAFELDRGRPDGDALLFAVSTVTVGVSFAAAAIASAEVSFPMTLQVKLLPFSCVGERQVTSNYTCSNLKYYMKIDSTPHKPQSELIALCRNIINAMQRISPQKAKFSWRQRPTNAVSPIRPAFLSIFTVRFRLLKVGRDDGRDSTVTNKSKDEESYRGLKPRKTEMQCNQGRSDERLGVEDPKSGGIQN